MLSQKQIDVICEPLHDYNILSGVTGSAKTFVSNLKWYEQIVKAPKDSLFLQSGNTEESLYDNITAKLFEIDQTDRELEYIGVAGKKRVLVKRTGTQVVCTGANTENAQNRIQGKSVNGWYGDEIVKQPMSFINMASSRCRIEKDGKLITTPIMWTCNPDSPSHPIKLNFIDNKKIDVKNWYFGFWDNPTMTQKFIDKMKATYSGVFYERMILGKWVLAEGTIYSAFSRDKHVKKRKELPVNQIADYYLAIDWGFAQDHPLCILLVAELRDGTYWVIDEIYEEGQLIDKSLKDIMDRKGWFKLPITYQDKELEFIVKKDDTAVPLYAYCDSARPDLMKQFRIMTGITTLPANKTVHDGIQSVARLFSLQANGKYGIYFTENCVNSIRDHELYRWDRLASKDLGKDVPLKINDHAPDGVRYLVHTRSASRVRFVNGDGT